jgi:vacuolar-type H+-ATPase subunit H
LVGMREDMEYISGVLDELEAIVQDASKVPMRKGRAVIDRTDLLVMLDELRGTLPGELSEAEAIRRECAAIVASAEEEARRIVEEAHERAEERVLDTELYRRSQRRAAEGIDRAELYAREIQGGSEVYQDRVLSQLESWFQDSLSSVGESRLELGNSPVRRTPMPTAETPPPAEENGHGWRASSA